MAGDVAARSARLGALVAGLAVLACAGAVSAQVLDAPIQKFNAPAEAPAEPLPDDGLSGGGVYLEADTLIRDEGTHRTTAQGAVQARYNGRTLRADEVDYDADTGVITARGHVQILNVDGTSQFAEAITLDKDLTAGLAVGFSTRLQGNVKIAAAGARRTSNQVTELDHVIFTPCLTCLAGTGSQPTWSIRASKVVEDRKRQTLYFTHAVIRIHGVSVFYFPKLVTADPTSERKSGFLLPLVVFSGARGLSYEQPYYQVITPSQDILITPQINSKVNPFLNINYRQRTYSGIMDIRAGYTYETDFTSGGDKFGNETSHSYILGSGIFKVNPKWQWGYTAEQTSDKLIFQKYGIGNVYEVRGLYAVDDQRLISQAYAVRQDSLSYFSIAALEIQGLRSTDIQSNIPIVAPIIEGRWEIAPPIVGGRLRLAASAVALSFDHSADDPQPTQPDSRRITGQLDWMGTYTLANGLRFQPFLKGRGDVYGLSYLLPASGSPPNQPYSDATVGRLFGTAGVTVTYPWIKQTAGVSYILEPTIQAAVSPNASQPSQIPNYDSEIFQFDETNLFETNRSPGYDLYEGGQSITLGERATAMLADGRSASLLVGRRFAASSDPVIPQRTGLQTSLSDYIVGADINPFRGMRLYSRLRLDTDSLNINNAEAGAEFTTARLAGYVSYLYERQSPAGTTVNSLDIHGEAFLTRHWGVTSYVILNSGTWRRQDFGVVYRDDCLRFEVVYRHDQTFNGTLGPSSSVVLRLTLATFGNSGYSR